MDVYADVRLAVDEDDSSGNFDVVDRLDFLGPPTGLISNVSFRWKKGEFIGAGSSGSVFSAVNLDTGSVVAVKEIRLKRSADLTSLCERVSDEFAVMEMLNHPNIAECYGIEVHRDKVYIFEEFCRGGNIASLLRHGRIEDESILQVYTLQILEGLAYLHSMGIVHCDIKPDNISLDHTGVIKLVDFGAAKVLARYRRVMHRSSLSRDIDVPNPTSSPGTSSSSLTGTPMYLSPEVIRNDEHGRHGARDVWSLGCVVLECATGRKPWSNLDNKGAILFQIGGATEPPPLPHPGELSEKGVYFVKQCLTIDPVQRPTALELMDDPWMLDFRDMLSSYETVEPIT